MNEVEPCDGWGSADAFDAMDVNLVIRGGKGVVNDLNGLANPLRRHETGIEDHDIVHRNVCLNKGQGLWIRLIKIEDMSNSEAHEVRNVLGQYPAALVDSRGYLSGVQRHTVSTIVLYWQLGFISIIRRIHFTENIIIRQDEKQGVSPIE